MKTICSLSRAARVSRHLAIGLAVAVSVACGRSEPAKSTDGPALEIEPGVQDAIRTQLSVKPAFLSGDREYEHVWKAVRGVYEEREYAPLWIDGRRPTDELDELLDVLGAAGGEGLDPAMYAAPVLIARRHEAAGGRFSRDAFEPADIDEVDVWSTWAFMAYASDLADGVTDPKRIQGTWGMRPSPVDLQETLHEAVSSGDIAGTLEEIAPRHPEYLALEKALADYRHMADQGGWKALPENLRLKPGAKHAAVPDLRARLAITHDYKDDAKNPSTVYDDALVEAVKLFQHRHGLAEDGVVAGNTLAALNVPVSQRIRQIQLNMERWRWLPRDLGKHHARVNIPEYRLDMWEGDDIVLTMRTVVGAQDNKTPIFADKMEYIVFSPYWNVPSSIASEETLPSVQADPTYLSRNNLEVVGTSGEVLDPTLVDWENTDSYRFRQKPGTSNSLGLVKFMFPNQHAVYLHDTPADALFNRPRRALSHGCVRVEQPTTLAQYLLRDRDEWTEDRIKTAMRAGKEQHVKLTEPVPVYLLYMTARASHEDGAVHFREDVYGYDRQHGQAYEERLRSIERRSASLMDTLSPGTALPGGR